MQHEEDEKKKTQQLLLEGQPIVELISELHFMLLKYALIEGKLF